jgi:colicin import membrane protein
MKRIIVALAMCAIVALARGAGDRNDAERARIRDERAQAQRLYEERERTCHERFAVTSCLDAARAQRRETMDRLRHEELVLDNATRKERAAARTTRIREKQIAQDSKPTQLVVRERPDAPPKPAPRALPPSASGVAAPASAVPRISDEQERRNRAAFEAKQRQAAEHRAEVERRNAERLPKTKPTAPLPVPKSASAP